ncbi:tRNA adenosine(34) deaminase TadA [Corallococcus sp. M34]|uniref:tRNA adenosine(34) deaminase TadA n=1 Tax=Citreicoccus inhibens TaxID=2849499 RepID=UPI001C23ECD6|nr:tRNA adenosine(34) deaminase TadA [Citreicoccus inhibens]MBU8899535.1 tRNA adenosine(34) deaminase TadA [Citreicoccus inhibens]
MSDDVKFMQQALLLAQEASSLGEVPVGAVAVLDGNIVGTGFNRREMDRNPFAHAEMLALEAAAKAVNAWRLTGITLYVTLEPCAMCAGALVQSRVTRLVFGTQDPKAGAVGSLYNLAEEPRHNHRLLVTSGILADESRLLLKAFFERLRAKRRDN